ncbi:hypothetical protein Tco_0044543 [Tanacetum coccineum]
MNKGKEKKKVEDDDEDFIVEEQKDGGNEKTFNSLRRKMTVPEKLPYFVLKNLDRVKMEVTLPAGSKIKITPRKIWEVLGIPMEKNPLVSDSLREYNDELLKEFKE